jgi:hypothetical protein
VKHSIKKAIPAKAGMAFFFSLIPAKAGIQLKAASAVIYHPPPSGRS